MTNDEDFLRWLTARTPAFSFLLAAEFNLDWDLDWPYAESVLVNDLDDASMQDNARYRDDLDLLLRELPTDDAVVRFFTYLDTGLSPEDAFGLSSRDWLIELRARATRNVDSAELPSERPVSPERGGCAR